MMSLLVLAVCGRSNLLGQVSHLNVSTPGRFEVQVQWNVLADPASMKFFNPITSDILINLTGLHKKAAWTKETPKERSEPPLQEGIQQKVQAALQVHTFNILTHHSMQCSVISPLSRATAQPRANFRTLGPPVSSHDVPFDPGPSAQPNANHNLCMLYALLMIRKTL